MFYTNLTTNIFSALRRYKLIIFIAIIITGVVLRLLAASHGFTYDFDSYKIQAHIWDQGASIYEATTRYNYSPIWFEIIGFLWNISKLFTNPEAVFRFLIPGFLTFVDIGIFFFLNKKYGSKIATLYFLCPISIIATGFNSMFDNFAILTALVGFNVYGENNKKGITRNKFLGLILLGFSICIKQIFIFFPLWLAIKQKGLFNKLIVLSLPVAIFVISFAFYINSSWQQILDNVILYRGSSTYPLVSFFMSDYFRSYAPLFLYFLVIVIISGILLKKTKNMDSALLYLIIIMIFAPSVFTYYLVIPLVSVFVLKNIFFYLYAVIGSYLMCLDYLALNLKPLVNTAPDFLLFSYNGHKIFVLPLILLFFGLLYYFFEDIIFDKLKILSRKLYKK